MVSSFFIHLENLPINANGKLDTKALPVPEKRSFKDPRNETKKKLQEIFSSFFGIEAKKISINDDFFMLGGDSIVSVQLVSKIKEELDYHVKSTDVFAYKTIESIYENVIHKQINSSLKKKQEYGSSEFDLQKWIAKTNWFESWKQFLNELIRDTNSIENVLGKLFFHDKESNYYFEPFSSFNDEINDANELYFLFPSIDGGAESYFNNIITKLKGKKRLIVFNNICLSILKLNEKAILENVTIEKVAYFYIGLIKKVQSKGPYKLFGWSLGGLLALEISRLLKLMSNEIVSNIIMVDTFIRISEDSKCDYSKFEHLEYYKQNFFDTDSEIVLFQASKYNGEEFKQFVDSNYNNLDKVVDPSKIKKIIMKRDDHFSWVKNDHQINEISKMF